VPRMKVSIKDFDVAMEVKNNGVEFEIYDNSNVHLGDLFITKAKVIWCKGKTKRANGVNVPWPKLIEAIEKV
jgi:hypothetical protein